MWMCAPDDHSAGESSHGSAHTQFYVCVCGVCADANNKTFKAERSVDPAAALNGSELSEWTAARAQIRPGSLTCLQEILNTSELNWRYLTSDLSL